MPVRQIDGRLCIVRIELSPSEIPSLLAKHAENYPGVPACEALGQELIQSGFDPDASVEFVQQVCKWGRGDRNISRVRRNNSASEVALALSEGLDLARTGKVAHGVERIRCLRNLGQSFASKQMRFLYPARAVVMDSVIRNRLGYAETANGYAEFLSDCQAILVHVRKSDQLPEPERLRISDIEAALFTKLQGSSK